MAAPVAAFSATPVNVANGGSVVFTDSSTNTPTSWLWEKNSGSGWVNFAGTPTAQNPTETFATGTWSVRLTATNAGGSDAEEKTDHVYATPYLNNLAAYWALDEASGNATDASGAGQTLTDNNTVTSAAGKVGTSRQFTAASTEYLSRASNAVLQTGDIDFTLAGWVWLDSKTTYRMLAGKFDDGSAAREYLVFYDQAGDVLTFIVSADGTATGSVSAVTFGAPPTGQWIFIVAWHNAAANTLNIQVNNGTADSAAHTTGVFVGTTAFILGGYKASAPALTHDGRLDEWGLWKRVLTAGERTSLYNAGAGRTFPFVGA